MQSNTVDTAIRTVSATEVGPLIYSGKVAPSPSGIQPIETVPGLNKPKGGLWTTRDGDPTWIDWCRREHWMEGCKGHSLHRLGSATTTAPVAAIDSEGDFERIIERYGYSMSYGEFIDFEGMARDGYAGIWLTDQGEWATRWLHRGNLYGWDLASVIWFRWVW